MDRRYLSRGAAARRGLRAGLGGAVWLTTFGATNNNNNLWLRRKIQASGALPEAGATSLVTPTHNSAAALAAARASPRSRPRAAYEWANDTRKGRPGRLRRSFRFDLHKSDTLESLRRVALQIAYSGPARGIRFGQATARAAPATITTGAAALLRISLDLAGPLISPRASWPNRRASASQCSQDYGP